MWDFEPTIRIDPEDVLEYVRDNKEWFLDKLGEDDYVYKLNSTNSDTIYYKSSYNYILMPSAFEELPLNIVGVTTFSDSDVEGVIIPEGVTIIE